MEQNTSVAMVTVADDAASDDDSVFRNTTIFAFIIGSIGAVSNAFVLLIFFGYSGMQKKPGTILILHQTLMDLISSVTIILWYSIMLRVDGNLSGELGMFICRFVLSEAAFWTAFNVASLNLVTITLERYLMVVHPIFHRNYFSKKVVYCCITLMWVAGCLFNIGVTIISEVVNGTCEFASNKVDVYVWFFGTFFIPVCLMLYFYGHVIYILVKKKASVQDSSSVSHQTLSKTQMNITRTMVIVSLIYVTCQFPHYMYYLLIGVVPMAQSDIPYYSTITLTLANCCVNPFIYAFKFEGFRNGAKKFLKLKGKDLNPETSVPTAVTNLKVGKQKNLNKPSMA